MTQAHQEMQPGNVVLVVMDRIVIAARQYPAKLPDETERVPPREGHIKQPRSQGNGFVIKNRFDAAG